MRVDADYVRPGQWGKRKTRLAYIWTLYLLSFVCLSFIYFLCIYIYLLSVISVLLLSSSNHLFIIYLLSTCLSLSSI